MHDLATNPASTSTGAAGQLLIFLTAIVAILTAGYLWAAVRHAAAVRDTAILGAFDEQPARPRVPEPQPTTCWRAPEPHGGRHAAGVTRQIDRVSLARAKHALRTRST